MDKSKGFGFDFDVPKEKAEKEILENEEEATPSKIDKIKGIEENVLRYLQFKLGAEVKQKIHLVLADPAHPVTYTPDAILRDEDGLIFVEVKYVRDQTAATRILPGAIRQIKTMMDTFAHSSDTPLRAYIVAASPVSIDFEHFGVPENVMLDFVKIDPDQLI